jgi:hypothetical protein
MKPMPYAFRLICYEFLVIVSPHLLWYSNLFFCNFEFERNDLCLASLGLLTL